MGIPLEFRRPRDGAHRDRLRRDTHFTTGCVVGAPPRRWSDSLIAAGPLNCPTWMKTSRSSTPTTICGISILLSLPMAGSGEHAWLGDYSRIQRSYLPAEYRRDTALHNVIATVHRGGMRSHPATGGDRMADAHSGRAGMPNAIVAHAWVDTPDADSSRPAPTRWSGHPHQAGDRSGQTIPSR